MPSLKILYHYIKTNIFYGPFCLKIGKRVIICNPILITPKNLRIGSKVFIRDFCRLEGVRRYLNIVYSPVIEIQDGVSIEQNLHLTCARYVVIGKDTAVASNVTITDINHPYENIDFPPERQQIEVKQVVIGERCKIYNNVVILPGTILGSHCVIGANSVVPGKKYKDYSIIVGAPAKVIKRYSIEKKQWLKTDHEGNFI